MLSRVAENIYWMARYLERAEDAARLISVNTNLLLDLPKGIDPGWEPLDRDHRLRRTIRRKAPGMHRAPCLAVFDR